jgi:tetratricopeptide (TPR) repeat protein
VAHPGIYYEGCVHESVTRRLAEMNMATAKADFVVHHLGHAEDSEQERRKKDLLYHALGVEKLKKNPDNVQALIEMGVAELDCSKKPLSALQYFERACVQSPESAVGWLYAGVCLARVGRFREAIGNLERAHALGLRTGFLYQAFGDAYFAGNQFLEANQAYSLVAEIGEGSPLTEAKRGASEVQLGLVDTGLARLQKAVADAPAYLELYDILATAALLARRLTLAVETVQARLALAGPTEFHVGLVAAIQAQYDQRKPIGGA